MGGSVWNWCSDMYRADAFAERSQSCEICCDPTGPKSTQGEKVIPSDPSPPTVLRVARRRILIVAMFVSAARKMRLR